MNTSADRPGVRGRASAAASDVGDGVRSIVTSLQGLRGFSSLLVFGEATCLVRGLAPVVFQHFRHAGRAP